MPYEQILSETRGSVQLLTLHRPEKLNAWTYQMRNELVAAITAANEDPAIGAIVLTGAGRAFCAGADVEQAFKKRIEGEAPAGAQDPVGRTDWVPFIRQSKPIVVALNGVAVGVGITMVLPCDVLIAGASARSGMFFVKMGLVPELASSHFLVQRVGFAAASEMCLSGRLLGAEELARCGLVNRVVADEDLLEEALATARAIAANPEPSLRAIKELLTQNGACDDLGLVQRREMEALGRAYETPEHREAVQAFLEKRDPDFRGARQAAESG